MLRVLATLLISLTLAAAASAQLMDKKALTLDGAKKLAAAAEAEATKNNWRVVIVIVDDGGHLVYLERIDDTQTGSIDVVAIAKARGAVAYKRPTKVFEDAVTGGRNVIMALPHAMPVEGGLPLVVDGKLVGGIGVSGVTSQQDGQIAKAGADALPKLLGR